MSRSDQEVAEGPDIRVRRMSSRAELERALAKKLMDAFTRAGLVMLSGGSTPKPIYDAIAKSGVPASTDVIICYTDERLVAQTSDANNYQMSRAMLDALGVPEGRRIYVRTELAAEEAALDYERRLQKQISSGAGSMLCLLGMGADGHTAGLFSHDDLARAHGRLAIAVQRADGLEGVSVTPGLLNQSSCVVLAIAGADKRQPLRALLAHDPKLVAWQAIRGCPDVEVWTDADAYPGS